MWVWSGRQKSNVKMNIYGKQRHLAIGSQENCKIFIDDEKTYLAISFDGKSPALVCLNKAKKAKREGA